MDKVLLLEIIYRWRFRLHLTTIIYNTLRNIFPPTYLPEFLIIFFQFSSVQSIMSDSLWPHGLQHARPPCSLPTPGVYPNSWPLSWWCHPSISSSVFPFSSSLQSFPASGSFQMSQLFASGGQSIGVSALASWHTKAKFPNLQARIFEMGFPGGTSGKKSACRWRKCKRFNPWLGKIPWSR